MAIRDGSHSFHRHASIFATLTAVVAVASLAACSSKGGPSGASAATGATGASPTAATSVSAPGSPPAPGSPTSAPPTVRAAPPDHVVVVVFENKEEAQVHGNADAPYFNELAARGATYTDWAAITHPSQPNYVAMFSGSTQGVAGDECLTPGGFPGPDLGGELIGAGRTFIGYSEGMPSAGYTGCRSGKYAAKHNPWVDFADVPAASNQPFTAFPSDFTRLPTVAFVVPDLCDDMHDCPVATGDAWLKKNMGAYADWAADHGSLLIVTWDEDDFTAKNVIPTTIVGAGVKAGSVVSSRVDHYSFLRTLEQMYKLPYAGASARALVLPGLGLAES